MAKPINREDVVCIKWLRNQKGESYSIVLVWQLYHLCLKPSAVALEGSTSR